MKGVFIVLIAIAIAFFKGVFADDVTHYTLIISDEIISPACSPRLSLVINGTLPGPELHCQGGEHVHIRYSFFNVGLMKGME
jgi:hypothetical protein